MDVSYCRHHPATLSRWHCNSCELSFCDACIYAPKAHANPGCLHCAEPLEFQPSSGDVVPFWARLNDFFTYPFQAGPIALLGLSIALSVVLSSGLLGILAAVFITLLQIKYGFNVIAMMSEGEFQAPSLPATITESNYNIVFKQFAVVVVMFIVTARVGATFGSLLAVPLAVLCFLVLPMSMIVLATERSLRAALNPVTLVTSVYRIGWPYLLVYLYLLMMFSCSLTFFQMTYEFVGPGAARVITSASGYYFALVMYSLMGYMAYQYRHKLPFGAPALELADAPDAAGEDPRIHVSLQQGEYARAMDLLASSWNEHPNPSPMIEKYVKIARFAGAWEHVRKRLTSLLAGLLKAEQTQSMPPLLRDLFAAQPEFDIDNTSLALQVADAVRERGDSKLAVRLLQNQHKITRDPELQRESIGKLADILEVDLDRADIAAKYRAMREKIRIRPAADDGGLSLAD